MFVEYLENSNLSRILLWIIGGFLHYFKVIYCVQKSKMFYNTNRLLNIENLVKIFSL